MNERKDLRDLIVPVTLTNTNEEQEVGNRSFNTSDLIYLDDYESLFGKSSKLTNEERMVALTDHAKSNRAWVSDSENRLNESTGYSWLRSAYHGYNGYCVGARGDDDDNVSDSVRVALRPLLNLNLKSNISARSALDRFFGNKSVKTED